MASIEQKVLESLCSLPATQQSEVLDFCQVSEDQAKKTGTEKSLFQVFSLENDKRVLHPNRLP